MMVFFCCFKDTPIFGTHHPPPPKTTLFAAFFLFSSFGYICVIHTLSIQLARIIYYYCYYLFGRSPRNCASAATSGPRTERQENVQWTYLAKGPDGAWANRDAALRSE